MKNSTKVTGKEVTKVLTSKELNNKKVFLNELRNAFATEKSKAKKEGLSAQITKLEKEIADARVASKTPAKGKVITMKGKPDAAIAKSKAKVDAKKETPVVKAPVAKTTTTRKVGDIHTNGLWVWKEIKEGKFDWRTIPSDKPKTTTPKADKAASTGTKKATKPAVVEPTKLTNFLKNKIKTEVTEKLKSNKSFQHALWAKQTENKLFVEFLKTSKVSPEKLAAIQAELKEQYKDLTVIFEVRKSLN